MLDRVEISERIKVKSAIDLYKCDVIIHVNKFNEGGLKQFNEDFVEAHETGQDIIPIVIDSFGGTVYSVLAMVDLIKASDKKIATIVMGKAMSCGAILLTCGDEGLRFSSPNATIMIHDVSVNTWGKMEEVKADAKEGERLNKLVFDLMERNCGLKRGSLLNLLRDKQNSADWYLTPHQAKKLNIVNHVCVPQLVTKVDVTTSLVI